MKKETGAKRERLKKVRTRDNNQDIQDPHKKNTTIRIVIESIYSQKVINKVHIIHSLNVPFNVGQKFFIHHFLKQ
jgi:hypothetical protein